MNEEHGFSVTRFKANKYREEAFRRVETKDYANALRNFELATREQSTTADFHWLGVLSLCIGAFETALNCFVKLVERNENDRVALHHLALIYAACPIETVRNGDLAIELAERAYRLSPPNYWRILSIIAAAHAERGEFASAMGYIQQALELAPTSMSERLRQRRREYESKQPYRMSLEDVISAFENREVKCRTCGRPAICVDAASPNIGECLNCWRGANSS